MTDRNGKRTISTDLAVIGTGLAGISASIFARNRGISCTLAGNTGALAYTTGYFDLLGFHQSRFISDPWRSLSQLQKSDPDHPLAAITAKEIKEAFSQFLSFLGQNGLGYSRPGDANLQAITPAGTVKPTLSVPLTMKKGVEALQNKAPCTIIGFEGLKGFSAHQIAANLQESWTSLIPKMVKFPGHESGELYAEAAARSLEVKPQLEKLAQLIKAEAGQSRYVGLPAVLGMHAPDNILDDLEKLTDLNLFEIPTMPPSVPGIRLREMFEQKLPGEGVNLVPQQKIRKISFTPENISLELSDNYGPITISAKTVLLASGRFLSGGLEAHFDRLSEPLLNLPVFQPPSRENWYHEEYLDSRGHEIHTAGIETDPLFRPLGRDRNIYDKRLFAAGIILAHQDWIRQRCGAGLAIATSYKAVEAIDTLLKKLK